ncbi:threonine synthase [Dokdonia donghaensis]|uniref:Threonine synthase n=1 Tax=Dokdonia donghaensis DSW-1 TaxID=1300343 RepID=A0A0A2H037_9FLAO|nr:threonine synthase [Dokdonia donghaensis]ANH60675.1 Threonine synthase [Dokdonia donghaensis DSW-1]KGO06045.1 threonine synthase [Dokdonia donghaensis DSW-1]
MHYYSLNNKAPQVTFDTAVIKGIAPDKGLYFPERIPTLPTQFWETIEELSKEEIAYQVMQPYVGDTMDETTLREIVADVLSFDFPIVPITNHIGTLELFHGPTMAFKDVGARFMARCLGHFLKEQNQQEEVTVLVATSGDTGGAVARGFYKVPGIKVVILYPSGKVSDVQERQLTTLGENITALEVDGTFDDCQAMVKRAFLDTDITNIKQLTSANSINVARWLPQSLYYLFAYKELKKQGKADKIVFSVPSGNFGNICAGMVAHLMGMPVHHFVAAVNSNTTIPRFMKTGDYSPTPTVPTISNAMDVSDPSNFVRVLQLFENSRQLLSTKFSSYSYCDNATRGAMLDIYKEHNYTADPHGAVGYLGLKEYLKDHPDAHGIFLETAHPIKFLPAVEPVVGPLALPEQIKQLMSAQKDALAVSDYQELKNYLLK